MAECPCSNISIMQLFHELKQKFPAIPDRVVTECIQLNAHNKEACEAVLSQENQSYSFLGRACKMAAEGNFEPCRPDSLQLEDSAWHFDRRLVGRQSLDSLRLQCTQNSGRPMCEQYSEAILNSREHYSDENIGVFSKLSVQDENWNRTHSQNRYHEVVDKSTDVAFGGEDSCQCERTRVSVVSYGSRTPHSAPETPSNYPAPSFPPLTVDVTTQRRFTSLNFEPVPHYQGVPEPSRPYTSVNLTLRPPSSDPQPPIDISSGSGGLTYSSCSYDPRQGYQSRLQISIGPMGQGTVTTARTLSQIQHPSPSLRPATSMPDVATTSHQLMEPSIQHLPPATKALVVQQLERKERLSCELNKYKQRLSNMQSEILNMKTDLENRLKDPASSLRVKRLREEITLLQTECNRMTNEVYHNAELRHFNTETLPLGETNEEFYKHIYRGQLFPRQTVRPRSIAAAISSGGSEDHHWTCHVCTFHNHPALNKCEQCDMPRIITGSLAPSLPSTRQPLTSA